MSRTIIKIDTPLVSQATQPMVTEAVDRIVDSTFRRLCLSLAALVIVLMAYILYEIGFKSLDAIKDLGFGFLTSTTWDATKSQFGILPEIWGTLYSSILALLIAAVFGLAVAIWLTQHLLPPRLESFLRAVVDLLAAIPSVVYGLWGIFVVIPLMRPCAAWLNEHFSWIPFFKTSLAGPGLMPAAIVLAIMILPTVSAISRDAIMSVPLGIKEAAIGLGATRWETIFKVILPTASRGIWAALVLGFGRALGETMAVAMLIGNSNQLSVSLFSPANTLAALLANHFPEAGPKETSILLYAALVLMLITLGVNIVGSLILIGATKQKIGEAGK